MSGPNDYVINGPGLYGRVYSLTMQTGPQTASVWGNESQDQSPMRVAFEIERATSGPAKAKIAIYNLTPKSRSAIAKGVACRLRAGYIGLIGDLFIGTVAKVMVTRQGPDIVTSLEMVDAEPYVSMSTLTQSYAPGTHLATILQDVAKAMSVTYFGKVVSIKAGIANGIPDHVYGNGFAAHGSCKSILDKLCTPRGLVWSVQNGQLNIIPKRGYNGRTLLLLNKDTGLINVPSDSGKAVNMQSLLNPAIVPNALVQLSSANLALSGVYKVLRTKYQGDSHDAPWNVDIEARRFTDPITPVKVAAGFNYAGAVTP